MHYAIDSREIKVEIENLGHKVSNIRNAKNYRTKQPLSMFFIDLQPAANNKDIFNVEFLQRCKIRFEPPKHTRDIAQCANCQRYGIQKIFVTSSPDALNALVTSRLDSAHVRNTLVLYDVSSAMAITLQTTRDARSTKTSKRKHINPCGRSSTLPPAPLQQTLHTRPGVTYAQIAQQTVSNPIPSDQNLPTNPTKQPHQTPSDIQDLKPLMKTLFEQLDTMLNLLTTVLSKLP
jgi:hypothetical protein